MSLKFEAIKYVEKKADYLRKKGIEVRLHDTQLLEDGLPVGGMFNSYTMKLDVDCTVSMKHWLPTFIHESQHAEQYIRDHKVWTDACNVYKGQDACTVIFNWLDGKEYPDDIVYKAIRLAQSVELDCEKRTVKELIKSGLGRYICTLKYTQEANAYIYFYNIVYMHRIWVGEADGDQNFQGYIHKIMPTNFNNDYSKMPLEYYRLCMKNRSNGLKGRF